MTSEVNVLGTFSYTYDGTSPRLATVTYPNSQTSTYSYFGASNDHRLQTIHHKYPNGSTLSKFDYTYDAAGNILTWRQQADATAVLWEYGYDTADQLVTAVKKSTDPTPQILQRFAYTYDLAGNRTAEQIDDALTTSTYNNMNQLVSQAPGGMLRFEGTLNEPATVTIGGKPAIVAGDNRFIGHTPVGTGTSQIEIRAIDPNGNIRTNTYEVSQSGSAKTLTYDNAGNLMSDGARTFEWDARNRLLTVRTGTGRVEFAYDGLSQRVKRLEEANGAVVAEIAWVRCDWDICEKRATDGTTILARGFQRGEQLTGAVRLFGYDHLDSVRSETDATGTLVGRYDYDPWGRAMVTSGTGPAPSFAGFETEPLGALSLGKFRWYDPGLGRWASEDPSGTVDGPNLFTYVRARPLSYIDPAGLQSVKINDPKVERLPKLPKGCPDLDGCGCTIGKVETECSCANDGWMLKATYTSTIYVNTSKWTPEWWIRRHEKGHVSDHIEVLRTVMSSSGGPYSSKPACESAAAAMRENFRTQAQGRAAKRDFFVKRFCW